MTGEPLTVMATAAALRSGQVSSAELVQLALDRADASNGELGAFLTLFPEQALAAARASDASRARGERLGALHGVPVAVKDNLATAEAPATAQSLVPHHEAARGDAGAVARLRAAGAVILGKTTLMEYACGLPDETRPFPVPRNPWDPARWAGGSSSGTASGIAAGLFPAGLGTDTGGSIRIPAAFCGITGLMPTFGRVPRTGCVPLAYSLDHVGPMARTAADCALLLQAIAGHDPADPCSSVRPSPRYTDALTGDLAGVRIGVDLRSLATDPRCDPAAALALEAAVACLREAGAAVTIVSLPLFAELTAACDIIYAGEMLAYQYPGARGRLGDYAASTRISLGTHAQYSGADYVQAQRVRRAALAALRRTYDEVDLVLTPTCATGAIPLADLGETFHRWFEVIYTPYWDGTGQPVISVPMGFTADGLPLAFQLAGRAFDEATVLQAADAYQRRTDWHLRAPAWPR